MAKKNVWDDLNDWLNTDGSPSPGGSSTKRPGDFGYRKVFPFGDRKPADAARSVAEEKARRGQKPSTPKPPTSKPVAPGVSKKFMPRKKK